MLDVETAVIAALGGNVSSRLPDDFEEHLPWTTIRRAPGSRYVDSNTTRLEVVRLQINTWGAFDGDIDLFTAHDGVLTALAALEGTRAEPCYITAVEIPETAQWRPDPETARPGYMAFASVYAHP